MHGDDGQDYGVDAMPVTGFLEVAVVLLASRADAGVEVGARDVDHVVEVEVGWFPAVASQAGVEPVFGAGKGGRLVEGKRWSWAWKLLTRLDPLPVLPPPWLLGRESLRQGRGSWIENSQ